MTHKPATVDLFAARLSTGLIHPGATPTPASNPRRSCYPDYPEPAIPEEMAANSPERPDCPPTTRHACSPKRSLP